MNYFPLKHTVVWQSLSKYAMFTYLCLTYNAFRSIFSARGRDFSIFVWGTQKGFGGPTQKETMCIHLSTPKAFLVWAHTYVIF